HKICLSTLGFVCILQNSPLKLIDGVEMLRRMTTRGNQSSTIRPLSLGTTSMKLEFKRYISGRECFSYIIKMFGGFGSTYFSEYHKIIPKSSPVEEYEDRI